jgi:hypothetical protein
MNETRRIVGALAFGFLVFIPTFGIAAFVALVLGAWLAALLGLVVGWSFWTAIVYLFMPAIDKRMKKMISG